MSGLVRNRLEVKPKTTFCDLQLIMNMQQLFEKVVITPGSRVKWEVTKWKTTLSSACVVSSDNDKLCGL